VLAVGRSLLLRSVLPLPYLHLAKTGGSSVGQALAHAHASACKIHTSHIHLPECDKGRRSLAAYRVAIVEGAHRYARQKLLVDGLRRLRDVQSTLNSSDAAPRLWLSAVRRPEDWFYSAIGHWCSYSGHAPQAQSHSVACKPYSNNFSLGTLRSAKLFSIAAPSYYFRSGDFQTGALRGFFEERTWLLCALPQLGFLARVLAHVLQRPVSLRHDNVATWHHRAAFKRAVPWSALRRLYARDEQFYDWLTRGGPNASCVGRAESAELRSMVDILGRNSGLRIRWRDAPGPPSSNEMAP